MNYIVNNQRVKAKIEWIVPLLVIPRLLLSIFDVPLVPSICSTIYICVFLYFFRYPSFRSMLKKTPLILWLLLIVYHHVNAFILNVPVLKAVDCYHAMKMYCAVCIYTYLFSLDFKLTCKSFMISLFVWLFLALLVTGFSVSGRLTGSKVYAVTIGKYSAMAVICIVYYFSVKKADLLVVLLWCLVPMVMIFLSQTRNALGMSFIQVLGFYYGVKLRGRIKINTIVPIILVSLFAYVGVNSVLEKTKIGARLMDEKSLDYYATKKMTTGTIFDKIAGERLVYYVNGFGLFCDNPINGIGYNNYQNKIGGHYPMHVEYMVHLCEGGIVAAIIFLLFLYSILRSVRKMKYAKPAHMLLMSTFLLQIFTSMYSVSFDQEVPVLVYGLLIASGMRMTSSSNNMERNIFYELNNC